jgi:DNA-directed RNA polymerase specialized sigma24 family protein
VRLCISVGLGPVKSISDDKAESNKALVDLFQSSWTQMVRLATFLTGSQSAAEDLVQDTFARLASRERRLEDAERYLRASVVNACRSYHRRRALERRRRDTDVGMTQDQPRELLDALGSLAIRQR